MRIEEKVHRGPITRQTAFMGHASIEVTKIYLEKPQSHYANLIDQL